MDENKYCKIYSICFFTNVGNVKLEGSKALSHYETSQVLDNFIFIAWNIWSYSIDDVMNSLNLFFFFISGYNLIKSLLNSIQSFE